MYRRALILLKLLQVSVGALSEERYFTAGPWEGGLYFSIFHQPTNTRRIFQVSRVRFLSEDRSSQAIASIFGVGGGSLNKQKAVGNNISTICEASSSVTKLRLG